ncbi:MAG: hypothetical protein O7A63_07685 [Acidobacteria bacterium]|nr:hypothetical protein [Acidobacteriota bacterium]
MKLDRVPLALTLLMLVVIGFAAFVPEIPGVYGSPHPDFPGMLRGGPGPERHDGILWIGWLFGLLQIALFVTLMIIGARRGGRPSGATVPLVFCGAIQAAVWTSIVLTYRGAMQDGAGAFILAFPIPSAILLYVLWPLMGLFTLCFVVGFRRWVLSDEDLAAFERLVAARARRENGD